MRLFIITGGSSGIGLALCREYLSRQYRVIDFSRSGAWADTCKVDLSAPDTASKSLAETLSALCREDYTEVIAVNNAATIAPIARVGAMAAEAALRHINVNFCSAILFMSEFTRFFQHHGARKVLANVSSVVARKEQPGWSTYCAAKAGIEHFIRCVALEQRAMDNGIAAFSYDPGIVDTPMQQAIREADVREFPPRDRFIKYYRDGILTAPTAIATALATLIEGEIDGGHTYAYARSS